MTYNIKLSEFLIDELSHQGLIQSSDPKFRLGYTTVGHFLKLLYRILENDHHKSLIAMFDTGITFVGTSKFTYDIVINFMKKHNMIHEESLMSHFLVGAASVGIGFTISSQSWSVNYLNSLYRHFIDN